MWVSTSWGFYSSQTMHTIIYFVDTYTPASWIGKMHTSAVMTSYNPHEAYYTKLEKWGLECVHKCAVCYNYVMIFTTIAVKTVFIGTNVHTSPISEISNITQSGYWFLFGLALYLPICNYGWNKSVKEKYNPLKRHVTPLFESGKSNAIVRKPDKS